VPITAREWAILELLAAGRGRVVPRLALLERIWKRNDESAAASLEVLIGRIRKKLGEDSVRTLRGEGYALGNG
jgi:DNA-binding response OmpR family regulator